MEFTNEQLINAAIANLDQTNLPFVLVVLESKEGLHNTLTRFKKCGNSLGLIGALEVSKTAILKSVVHTEQ